MHLGKSVSAIYNRNYGCVKSHESTSHKPHPCFTFSRTAAVAYEVLAANSAYSGTPLNGHPSTADTHVISDSSESLDRHSVDFNTLEPPE